MKEILIAVWFLCFVLFGFALVETAMLQSLQWSVRDLQHSVDGIIAKKDQQRIEVTTNVWYGPDWPTTNFVSESWQATNVFEFTTNTTNTNRKETP